MKIGPNNLHFPPYISTSWDQVKLITADETKLTITLVSGREVHIPELEAEVIEAVFDAYQEYRESIDTEASAEHTQSTGNEVQDLFSGLQNLIKNFKGMPVQFGVGIEGLESLFENLPNEKPSPELIKQVQQMTKMMGINPNDLPRPEPHSQTAYSQILRAIRNEEEVSTPDHPDLPSEEEVYEEDIAFQQWLIKKTGDNLYDVINKLNPNEVYQVYLGNPVGCTCGESGCEHLLTVLRDDT